VPSRTSLPTPRPRCPAFSAPGAPSALPAACAPASPARTCTMPSRPDDRRGAARTTSAGVRHGSAPAWVARAADWASDHGTSAGRERNEMRVRGPAGLDVANPWVSPPRRADPTLGRCRADRPALVVLVPAPVMQPGRHRAGPRRASGGAGPGRREGAQAAGERRGHRGRGVERERRAASLGPRYRPSPGWSSWITGGIIKPTSLRNGRTWPWASLHPETMRRASTRAHYDEHGSGRSAYRPDREAGGSSPHQVQIKAPEPTDIVVGRRRRSSPVTANPHCGGRGHPRPLRMSRELDEAPARESRR